MPIHDGPPGSGTISRLVSRMDRKHLSRQTMPGGGEVFSGPLASRALKALGARAMTVDRSIVVAEDFDRSNPEDQALFAHEQHHLTHSGGEGGHGDHDAEEVEARAVEAMVFHRAAAGGYEGGYSDGGGAQGGNWGATDQNRGQSQGVSNANDKADAADTEPDAGRGYNELRAQGYSHPDIVNDMARRVLAAMDDSAANKDQRHMDKKGWM